ncbi:MAG: 50S ribosomal protein L11 methyltransferase [Desulfobacterales bacterium]|nr:50S ribosomal protein L11 methyltransferase [Desulfobacterales bacterium]
MKNPYENLHIYNFNGIPAPHPGLASHDAYLGTWEEDGTSFLFFNEPADGIVSELEASNPDITFVQHYEMSCEQWHGDRIEPYWVENFCIAPPWDRPDPGDLEGKGLEILLDPGVVFGTGRHQTTEDCLTLIHRVMSKQSIGRVLDIGTGTGLLSLGAAALGCRQVMACDFNSLAVKTCLANIRLNRFEDRVLAFIAKGEEMISIPSDLLVANIHYDVMQHIISHPGFLEKPWFILSGLLNSEASKVLAFLKKRPVHIVERRCPDGIWNTILGKRL